MHRAVYDAFVEKLVPRVRALKVGNGLDPDVEMGPCVSEKQRESVLRYVEIGKRLKAGGHPEDRFYRDWIDTYSSTEFQEFADWLIGRMNAHAAGAPAQRREHWHRLYESSARYEYLFFDMSWKKEE